MNPAHSLPSYFFTTNFNIKEQGIHLTLNEHDDDDDEILILISHPFLNLQLATFFQGSLPKQCMHFSSSQYVQHVLLSSQSSPICHPNNIW